MASILRSLSNLTFIKINRGSVSLVFLERYKESTILPESFPMARIFAFDLRLGAGFRSSRRLNRGHLGL